MSEVDNLIASVPLEAPEQVKAPVEEPKELDSPAEPEEAEKAEPEDATTEDSSEEWDPKRAKNRISRQDKRIAKLTWERHQQAQQLAELQAQLSKTNQPQESQKQTPSDDGRPNEADYVGRYDDFIREEAKWFARQEAKSLFEQNKQQETEKSNQQQQAQKLQEMVSVVDKAAINFIKEVPDAASALKEFEDLDLSPQVAMAVIGLGEPAPKAVYQLWKAGKLDELESANPMQVQILLASALATPFTKPVSKAPTPLKSAKGSTSSAINPESYNPDELLKLIRKG